jgi:hypothetical protein
MILKPCAGNEWFSLWEKVLIPGRWHMVQESKYVFRGPVQEPSYEHLTFAGWIKKHGTDIDT